MASHVVQARSLYRRLLRELPSRTPSILANPSPIQRHIRADFAVAGSSGSDAGESNDSPSASSLSPHPRTPSLEHQLSKPNERRLQEAQQYLHYLRAQREYLTLIERYNPGMNMNEEEKVRLTARRVGMDLPVELLPDGGKE